MPLLEALHDFARSVEPQTLPSGKPGEALAYFLRRWTKLIRYVEDGRLAIYGIVETAKANAVEPHAHLRKLLGQLHHAKAVAVEARVLLRDRRAKRS